MRAGFELVLPGSTPTTAGTGLHWPESGGRSDEVVIDIDPWFSRFGAVPNTAVDLARIGVAVHLVDQLVRRPRATWKRSLVLAVPVTSPARCQAASEHLTALLHWLTGDEWTLQFSTGDDKRPPTADVAPTKAVNLFSGGVDSLCGAFLADDSPVYISHWDNSAVRRSQNRLAANLRKRSGFEPEFVSVSSHPTARVRKEHSTRTRSMMFTCLGTALASARGATHLRVPENGFTSLNPPLAANRGGPHTTRSTHPMTFILANAVNAALGIDVTITNPHEWQTKGALVRQAADRAGDETLELSLADSLSCATLNGQWYKGGDPNLNCGICVACMTRRGAIAAARLHDRTQYLSQRLTGASLEQFMRQRGGDIAIVRACRRWQPSAATLVAMGPFASGFDHKRALALLADGIGELVRGLP